MRYKTVDVRLWGDSKFRSLSGSKPSAQGLFIYFLINPYQQAFPGLYKVSETVLMDDLGWGGSLSGGFRKAFREVLAKGLARYDFDARVLFVQNAIRYNLPQSPNVIRSWVRNFDEIPECKLKVIAYHTVKKELESLSEGFRKAFREAFREPFANQEQEQEQDQEHNTIVRNSEPTKKKSSSPISLLPEEEDGYQQFKKIYPRQAGWADAKKAWRQVDATKSLQIILKNIAERQDFKTREKKFIPLPATFLRGERWNDKDFDDEFTPIESQEDPQIKRVMEILEKNKQEEKY